MPLTTSDAPGNMSPSSCDVCGRAENFAGYAAVPGAAMTIGWCHECLQKNCQPIAALEVAVCHLDPENPENDESLAEAVATWKRRGVGPELDLAEWFLEESVYVDGGYVRIRDLLLGLWNEAPEGGA